MRRLYCQHLNFFCCKTQYSLQQIFQFQSFRDTWFELTSRPGSGAQMQSFSYCPACHPQDFRAWLLFQNISWWILALNLCIGWLLVPYIMQLWGWGRIGLVEDETSLFWIKKDQIFRSTVLNFFSRSIRRRTRKWPLLTLCIEINLMASWLWSTVAKIVFALVSHSVYIFVN